MKVLTNLSIPSIIILGLSTAVFLLNKAHFFSDFKTSTLNEVLTPIATIIAFIIYYATLIEMQKTNKKSIQFQNISFVKERMENLKYRLESQKISIIPKFQEKFKLDAEYNLVHFFKAYKEIHKDMRNLIEQNDKEIYDHSMFFFDVCFQFNLNVTHIENVIQEIKNSDFDKLQKNIIKEHLIKILNDYLYVVSVGKNMKIATYTYTDYKERTIQISGYDAPFHSLPFDELFSLFDKMEFAKIYDLIKSEKII
ncbi:MAG: hypothetical protein BGO40_07100 [Chryseobacterium sp. 39-10]|nr:hypothetical protein [Chryseobacterium sp.]OJV48250.1 MAG: hypothetical protein BGO40_07100 [Chryseobacterium sp. 39-10]